MLRLKNGPQCVALGQAISSQLPGQIAAFPFSVFHFFLSFLVPLYVHISDYISCNILLINLKAVMIGTLAMKAIFT